MKSNATEERKRHLCGIVKQCEDQICHMIWIAFNTSVSKSLLKENGIDIKWSFLPKCHYTPLASVTFYFKTAFDSRYFGSRIDTNLMEKFQLFITDCRCSKVVEQRSLLSVITIIQCIDCLLVNNIIEQAILQKRSESENCVFISRSGHIYLMYN